MERIPENLTVYDALRDAAKSLLYHDGFILDKRTVSLPESLSSTLDVDTIHVTQLRNDDIHIDIAKPETADIPWRHVIAVIHPERTLSYAEITIHYTQNEQELVALNTMLLKQWAQSVEQLDEIGYVSFSQEIQKLNDIYERSISAFQQAQIAVELGLFDSVDGQSPSLDERYELIKKGLRASVVADDSQFSHYDANGELSPLMRQYLHETRELVHSFGEVYAVRAEVVKRAMLATANALSTISEPSSDVVLQENLWRFVSTLDACQDF